MGGFAGGEEVDEEGLVVVWATESISSAVTFGWLEFWAKVGVQHIWHGHMCLKVKYQYDGYGRKVERVV